MTESANSLQLRVASYNIHSWQGTDGHTDPERVMAVIEGLDADIMALQEVVSPRLAGAHCSLGELASRLGYHPTFGQTMLRTDARYGNALLSRREPERVVQHDLSFAGREPRGALEIHFTYGDKRLKVVATHLGLTRRERASQLGRLAPLLDPGDADGLLLLGDFNDWLPCSGLRRSLRRHFGRQPEPRTFPSRLPVLPLDKVHFLPGDGLVSTSVVKTGQARTASDHLPLLAEIVLG